MPVRTDGTITTAVYRKALDFPVDAIDMMRRDPRSNIILAKIEKYRSLERNGHQLQDDEFWIICSTTRTTSRGTEDTSVDFVVACTDGVIGKYPIFIFSTRFEEDLNEEYLEHRMMKIVRRLKDTVSPRRVYSVFAVHPVATSFAGHWSQETRIDFIREPYYDANFSYCSPQTLAIAPAPPSAPAVGVRLARESDTEQVARLCGNFAADSPPFTLDAEGALSEARKMIRERQVWVLEVRNGGGSNIACIVCLTRSNDTVTAITKVYTHPDYRKKGHAYRLVYKVCEHLFGNENKSYIVLYVGRDNPAAHVYSRAGFVGLKAGTQSDFKHVENWLELGFDRTKVDLGHW